MVHGVRRRVLFIATGILVVGGVFVAILVFPTRYRCNGDDLTFTTSRSFAEETCATGITGDVVADRRLAPRAAVIATVVFSATILLRIVSDDAADGSSSEASQP